MKFRISTLLWLMLVVACFFAGMSWNEFGANRSRGSAMMVVNKSVTLSTPSGLPISRFTIHDTAIASTVVRSGSVEVTGAAEGTTTVSLWDEKGARTDYSVAVKPTPIVVLSEKGRRLKVSKFAIRPK